MLAAENVQLFNYNMKTSNRQNTIPMSHSTGSLNHISGNEIPAPHNKHLILSGSKKPLLSLSASHR